MKKIYIVGSMKNPKIPELAIRLRQGGYNAFDSWFSPGPQADQYWQEHETQHGRTFIEALAGPHAQNVFQFDKFHLDDADVGVLVLPAGKSGHLELGYLIGKGKPGYILLDGEPDKWDVMYGFSTKIFMTVDELIKELQNV
jgi:nucleoside 2-deoxyribosyltransferase